MAGKGVMPTRGQETRTEPDRSGRTAANHFCSETQRAEAVRLALQSLSVGPGGHMRVARGGPWNSAPPANDGLRAQPLLQGRDSIGPWQLAGM